MTREEQKDLASLRQRIDSLETELALRTMDTTFLIEVPKEHRVHGQHAPFLDGVETAWRGRSKNNPYEWNRPQYRAWDLGYKLAVAHFAKMFVAGLHYRGNSKSETA